MPKYKNVEPMNTLAPVKPKKNWFAGLLGAGSLALVSASHAEGIEDVGTVITSQFASAQTIVISILIAAATITAIIIGYKKLSSGAKSA